MSGDIKTAGPSANGSANGSAQNGVATLERRLSATSDFFSKPELDALCNYKNKGADYSITYRYIMSPFYDRAVNLLPMTMAPNTVTLLGLLAVSLAHAILVAYAPTFSEVAPRWVYAVNCLGLFTYMTLDNLDGRQARRTGSSSPLGHLFDHLCDALNVIITGLGVAATFRLGNTIWTFLLVWCFGMSVFEAATLEEFYTGALILREINGANEGLIFMQCVYLVAALFGTSTWTTPVVLTDSLTVPLTRCIMFMVVPVSLPTIVSNYVAIFKHSVENQIAPNQLYSALRASLPFVLSSTAVFTWAAVSDVMQLYPQLFVWHYGLCFVYTVSYTIVAHLCGREELPAFSVAALPPVVGMVNAVASKLVGVSVPELPLLIVNTAALAALNAKDTYRIAFQICNHLQIRVFSIDKKQR